MKKMMAMVATIVMAITMVGCGQAIPATTVNTKKLEVPMTENVIVENIETENIETEEIIEEEKETKRELMIILRFRNEKTGTILFHMAVFDNDSFFIERNLDDLVEALNDECADTYLKCEENKKMVVKRIDEKKSITNVPMADVKGDEDELK